MRARTLLLGMLGLSAVGSAQAATLAVNDVKPGFYQSVQISINGQSESVLAGTLDFTLTGGPSGYPTTFEGYCIDPWHDTPVPTSYGVNVLSTSLLTNGPQVAWLYDHYGTSAFGTKVANATQAAALQIALWDVIADSGDGLSNGNLRYTTTGSILDQANLYLSAWNHQTATATWLQATDHGTNNTLNQDMIGPAVPEPGILCLLGASATLGLALQRRRDRQAENHR